MSGELSEQHERAMSPVPIRRIESIATVVTWPEPEKERSIVFELGSPCEAVRNNNALGRWFPGRIVAKHEIRDWRAWCPCCCQTRYNFNIAYNDGQEEKFVGQDRVRGVTLSPGSV